MFFTKKFYTEKEIKEMLINYHEHGRKGIERLNKLKYFVANKNYSRLEVMQEYDIVELDEEKNLIKFTDSSKSKNKVKFLVSYKYYDNNIKLSDNALALPNDSLAIVDKNNVSLYYGAFIKLLLKD